MSKIMKFSKPALKELRSPIEEALKELGEKYGISLRVGNGNFGDVSAKFTLEMKVADTSVLEQNDRREFSAYAQLFGLRGIDFGTRILLSGVPYEVAGFAMSRKKYPIKMRNVATGKIMLYTTDIVERIRKATDLNNAA